MFRAFIAVLTIAAMQAPAADRPQTVILDINGISCASCPVTVKPALKKAPGVADVKVDNQTSTAEVRSRADITTRGRLAKTV
jgi:copper chaperone CopZ